MKKIVLLLLVLMLSSIAVHALWTVRPQGGDSNSTREGVSEVTGSATIDPGKVRAGNTIAMLILAVMGVGLYGVLRYCKKNV